MASIRGPIGELTTLDAADDINGEETLVLDLTGSQGAIIIQLNSGTAGTAGIDGIEFSRDGGTTWAMATAANIGRGHAGLILEDGTAAAATGALLNAAGAEPAGAAVFSLGPVDGPFRIRNTRNASIAATTAAWVTGAPAVVALRLG